MSHKKLVEMALVARKKSISRSSMLLDTDGTLYSYGYHYPLLFMVKTPNGDFAFRNVRGYSASTSKHICRAGARSDFDVEIPRNVRGGWCSDFNAWKNVKKYLTTQRAEHVKNIEELSARAWRQKENNLEEIAKIDATINKCCAK